MKQSSPPAEATAEQTILCIPNESKIVVIVTSIHSIPIRTIRIELEPKEIKETMHLLAYHHQNVRNQIGTRQDIIGFSFFRKTRRGDLFDFPSYFSTTFCLSTSQQRYTFLMFMTETSDDDDCDGLP